jgi:hypothetical protein
VPLVAAAVCHAACSDDGSVGDITANDSGVPQTQPEGGNHEPDAEVPTTTIRIAHLAPEVGPIDFCWRTRNEGNFEGPVLGGGSPQTDAGVDADASDADADAPVFSADAGVEAGDGGVKGIGYRSVSTYTTLSEAGPITIALVPRGANTCANPIYQEDLTLDAGKLSTVVLLGRGVDAGVSSLALVALTDDRTTDADKARVRLVHAALGTAARGPSGTLAARAIAGQVVDLAEAIEPKHASSQSASVPVDELGYATVAPVPPPAALGVSERASASDAGDAGTSSWASDARDLGLSGGSLHTGFVLTGENAPFEVLWCTDTSTSGERTACDLIQ